MPRITFEITDDDVEKFRLYATNQLARMQLNPDGTARVFTDEEVFSEVFANLCLMPLHSQYPTPQIEAQQKALRIAQAQLGIENQKLVALQTPKRAVSLEGVKGKAE